MKSRPLLIRIITAMIVATSMSCSGGNTRITAISVNTLTDPMGVSPGELFFGWKIVSARRNLLQSAYQVVVYRENKKTVVWDSGKTESDNSIRVKYAGPELIPGTVYFWKVKVWDSSGKNSGWSKAGRFVTGLMTGKDWSGAKWIGYDAMDPSAGIFPGIHVPGSLAEWKDKASGEHVIPLLRKEFKVKSGLKHALVYVSGMGQYELNLNGKKVGDRFLSPGWTHYDTLCFYNVYDITRKLRTGRNVFGMWLGNGFFNIPNKGYRKLITAYANPAMILKLELTYHDGSRMEIISDETWKVSAGPVTFSSIFAGETFDANLVQSRWNKPGFDDFSWKNAVTVKSPSLKLEAEEDYPVKVMEKINVKEILRTGGTGEGFLYDFGQNASGIVEIEVKGNKGDTVRLIPAELKDEQNHAIQDATGKPYCLTYILKGGKKEKWAPRFTYYGFRYVEVKGAVPASMPSENSRPVIHNMRLLHTRNSSPQTGEFYTSDTLFNRINTLIRWAIRSNFQSVLTDCPHREKLGWLEQTYLMGNSVHFNYDIYPLFKKQINDMITAQLANGMVPSIAPEYTRFAGGFLDSPEWGSAAVILPWLVYEWNGDTGPMKKAWPMMTRYADYLESKSENHILGFGLGDWFDLGPGSPGVAQLTPIALTATAIYYYDVRLLARMATLLGKTEETLNYNNLAEEIKRAFNDKFFDRATNLYSTGSQTAMAMPLVVGLVDENLREPVFRALIQSVNNSGKALTAGDIGFHFLVKALCDGEAGELLYEMNARSDVPGYGFQLKKGATSLTESWAALEKVSNNHLMLGHIMEWFYSGLAGISQTSTSVAFREIIIAPQMVQKISETEASFSSSYGLISSHWKKNGKDYQLDVEIPANTTALVHLPCPEGSTLKENNKPLPESWSTKKEPGKLIIRIGSGKYSFSARR